MQEAIYSKKLIAGSKTYFFDVRETKSKEKYLQITETRLQNGERIKNSISIFNDHFGEFCKTLNELSDKLEIK
jgi:Protein of unknown function (DUF3276).